MNETIIVGFEGVAVQIGHAARQIFFLFLSVDLVFGAMMMKRRVDVVAVSVWRRDHGVIHARSSIKLRSFQYSLGGADHPSGVRGMFQNALAVVVVITVSAGGALGRGREVGTGRLQRQHSPVGVIFTVGSSFGQQGGGGTIQSLFILFFFFHFDFRPSVVFRGGIVRKGAVVRITVIVTVEVISLEGNPFDAIVELMRRLRNEFLGQDEFPMAVLFVEAADSFQNRLLLLRLLLRRSRFLGVRNTSVKILKGIIQRQFNLLMQRQAIDASAAIGRIQQCLLVAVSSSRILLMVLMLLMTDDSLQQQILQVGLGSQFRPVLLVLMIHHGQQLFQLLVGGGGILVANSKRGRSTSTDQIDFDGRPAVIGRIFLLGGDSARVDCLSLNLRLNLSSRRRRMDARRRGYFFRPPFDGVHGGIHGVQGRGHCGGGCGYFAGANLVVVVGMTFLVTVIASSGC
mmetsp:Transcript_25137/g.52970  ORF Transcript_25137/g.52970 Transcript_25137/m.52970 type:complete len:457 (+) Transcript_25137:2559-3929(+)